MLYVIVQSLHSNTILTQKPSSEIWKTNLFSFLHCYHQRKIATNPVDSIPQWIEIRRCEFKSRSSQRIFRWWQQCKNENKIVLRRERWQSRMLGKSLSRHCEGLSLGRTIPSHWKHFTNKQRMRIRFVQEPAVQLENNTIYFYNTNISNLCQP